MTTYVGNKAKGHAFIVQGCAEEIIQDFDAKSFDLVFSSPPYFNLEKYSTERCQSAIRFPTYSDWLDCFLGKVIRDSRRVLKNGGWFVINVADRPGYPIARDATRIAKGVFGPPRHIFTMHLSANPADKARRGAVWRKEPILAFRRS